MTIVSKKLEDFLNGLKKKNRGINNLNTALSKPLTDEQQDKTRNTRVLSDQVWFKTPKEESELQLDVVITISYVTANIATYTTNLIDGVFHIHIEDLKRSFLLQE